MLKLNLGMTTHSAQPASHFITFSWNSPTLECDVIMQWPLNYVALTLYLWAECRETRLHYMTALYTICVRCSYAHIKMVMFKHLIFHHTNPCESNVSLLPHSHRGFVLRSVVFRLCLAVSCDALYKFCWNWVSFVLYKLICT